MSQISNRMQMRVNLILIIKCLVISEVTYGHKIHKNNMITTPTLVLFSAGILFHSCAYVYLVAAYLIYLTYHIIVHTSATIPETETIPLYLLKYTT